MENESEGWGKGEWRMSEGQGKWVWRMRMRDWGRGSGE